MRIGFGVALVVSIAACNPSLDSDSGHAFDAPPEATFVAETDVATCLGPGTYCNSNADCCQGLMCNTRVCVGPPPPTCQSIAERCVTSIECCGPGLCASGVCDSMSCLAPGQACTRNVECCGASVCQAGRCS